MGKNGKNEEGDKKHLGKRAKNDGKARFGERKMDGNEKAA
jgi:hypothetical protein